MGFPVVIYGCERWTIKKAKHQKTDAFVHPTEFCMSLYILSEKAMAPHSSTRAWKIPWMDEPGGLQSMGS